MKRLPMKQSSTAFRNNVALVDAPTGPSGVSTNLQITDTTNPKRQDTDNNTAI